MSSAGNPSCAFQPAQSWATPSSSAVTNPTSWKVAPLSHETSLSTCAQQVCTWHTVLSVAVMVFAGPRCPVVTMSQVTDTVLQESLERPAAVPVIVTSWPPAGNEAIVDGVTVPRVGLFVQVVSPGLTVSVTTQLVRSAIPLLCTVTL